MLWGGELAGTNEHTELLCSTSPEYCKLHNMWFSQSCSIICFATFGHLYKASINTFTDAVYSFYIT